MINRPNPTIRSTQDDTHHQHGSRRAPSTSEPSTPSHSKNKKRSHRDQAFFCFSGNLAVKAIVPSQPRRIVPSGRVLPPSSVPSQVLSNFAGMDLNPAQTVFAACPNYGTSRFAVEAFAASHDPISIGPLPTPFRRARARRGPHLRMTPWRIPIPAKPSKLQLRVPSPLRRLTHPVDAHQSTKDPQGGSLLRRAHLLRLVTPLKKGIAITRLRLYHLLQTTSNPTVCYDLKIRKPFTAWGSIAPS
jgi:hypothetical protein